MVEKKFSLTGLGSLSRAITLKAKASNMYKIKAGNYSKLQADNVATVYKKAKPEIIQEIDNEAKAIAEEAKLDDRTECFAK